MGGATLSEHPSPGATGIPPMNGSALIVVSDTKEEVLELLRGDIYARSGVWDVDNATLYPVGFCDLSCVVFFEEWRLTVIGCVVQDGCENGFVGRFAKGMRKRGQWQ